MKLVWSAARAYSFATAKLSNGTTLMEDTVCASGSPRPVKVVVFLELAADVRIPPELDARSGRVRREWLVRELDPAGARALDIALDMKAASPDTEVTVIHLGPPDTEPWLRQALARGCDRAVRVWDEEAAGACVIGKALILTAAAEAAGFDLILAGASGVITSSGQLGALVAENLRLPCVTQAVEIRLSDGAGRLQIDRGLDQGFRERVEAPLPLVATVTSAEATSAAAAPADVTVAALLAARDHELNAWDLTDLGIPRAEVLRADRPLIYGPPRPRRPRLHRLAAPDPALPAFERILELVRGSLQTRQGRVVEQPAEVIVEEIFTTLKDEGWLDHLRVSKDRDTGESEADGPGGATPGGSASVEAKSAPEAGERL
jgi:electron transfer flavoprotein alpha/beta subunit